MRFINDYIYISWIYLVPSAGWIRNTSLHIIQWDLQNKYSNIQSHMEIIMPSYSALMGRRSYVWKRWSYALRWANRESSYISGQGDFSFMILIRNNDENWGGMDARQSFISLCNWFSLSFSFLYIHTKTRGKGIGFVINNMMN